MKTTSDIIRILDQSELSIFICDVYTNDNLHGVCHDSVFLLLLL